MKPDGKYRICGVFNVTVNQALMVNQYPLPEAEDLFATLAGGKKFTKLHPSEAYLQLQLEPESIKYSTINTHQVPFPSSTISIDSHLGFHQHLQYFRK